MAELTARIIIDNIPKGTLQGEWGLAVYIEYQDRKILLDTGASDCFLKNAADMGIDLREVEYAALSHAHDDHSGGMDAFFQTNHTAPFFLRSGTGEDCYSKKLFFQEYIGLRKGMLSDYPDRIRMVSGDYEVCPGVYLIPHKTPNLDRIGKKAHMYRKIGGHWQLDDFRHEQSLVLDTHQGLVIFNSCSHGGADNIIRETEETFPGKSICAIIGGFHLFRSSDAEVRAFARRILDTGIRKIVTGHCTGQKAFDILKQELGERIDQMYTGYTLEI